MLLWVVASSAGFVEAACRLIGRLGVVPCAWCAGALVRCASMNLASRRYEHGSVRDARDKAEDTVDQMVREEYDVMKKGQKLRAVLWERMATVSSLFQLWDVDRSGEINREEFHQAINALGVHAPARIVDELFNDFDTDGSGALSYNEFMRAVLRAGLSRSANRVMGFFKDADIDGSGEINKPEFRAAVKSLGWEVSGATVHLLDELFDSMDADGSGSLSFAEVHKHLRTGIGMDKQLSRSLRPGAAGDIKLTPVNRHALRGSLEVQYLMHGATPLVSDACSCPRAARGIVGAAGRAARPPPTHLTPAPPPAPPPASTHTSTAVDRHKEGLSGGGTASSAYAAGASPAAHATGLSPRPSSLSARHALAASHLAPASCSAPLQHGVTISGSSSARDRIANGGGSRGQGTGYRVQGGGSRGQAPIILAHHPSILAHHPSILAHHPSVLGTLGPPATAPASHSPGVSPGGSTLRASLQQASPHTRSLHTHTYLHACMHTYMHACIHTNLRGSRGYQCSG